MAPLVTLNGAPEIKTMCIFGTRPEAIKMAPVIRALHSRPHEFETQVVFMGQHRELVEPFIELFALAPDHSIDCMSPAQRLGEITARLIERLEQIVLRELPDWILAQGDTVTTLAAAIVSHFCRCRFGHVEAGLRSGNFAHPHPEEFNRRVADIAANAYFAPTAIAREKLLAEGVPEARVVLSGNTVMDALDWVSQMPFDWAESPIAPFARMENIVLVTLHRRENFRALKDIFCAINNSANKFTGHHFIYPVHPNPAVRERTDRYLRPSENLHLIEPLDYRCFVNLMRKSRFIVSDSGGVQEEAPFFGVPVLVAREETERPEALALGHNTLIGTSAAAMEQAIADQINHPVRRESRKFFGDGNAAQRIAEFLLRAG